MEIALVPFILFPISGDTTRHGGERRCKYFGGLDKMHAAEQRRRYAGRRGRKGFVGKVASNSRQELKTFYSERRVPVRSAKSAGLEVRQEVV